MASRTTRTLNRLPFQDLEPHRFEDLVRGIAHSFRTWRSLEDTGRTGDDDGIDIRGTEASASNSGAIDDRPEADAGEDGNEDERATLAEGFSREDGHTWIFQCKREKRFGPADVDALIAATGGGAPPYGFVVAVAADVTKRTRDKFRRKMAAWGVAEFHIWARGELEDLIFQPRHDHLLFAFFGISLQTRKRGVATDIRGRVAIKRHFARLFKGSPDSPDRLVVIRHIDDRTYPQTNRSHTRRWRLFRYVHAMNPDGLAFETSEYLAWLSADGSTWDAILDHDIAERTQHRRLPHDAWGRREHDSVEERRARADEFWDEAVSDADKAALHVAKLLGFDDIVAIDPFGDGYYPVPHVFVSRWDAARGPFQEGDSRWLVRRAGHNRSHSGRDVDLWRPDSPGFFPKEFDERAICEFDITETGSLGALAVSRLEEACAKRATPELNVARVGSATTIDGRLEQGRDQFNAWRTTIALPRMSAVVHQLRGAGCAARVVARVPTHLAAMAPQGSIEMRFSKEAVAPAGHKYARRGHFRVEFSWGDKCKVAVSPTRRDARGTYLSSEEERPLDRMSAEWLEEELVSMVERFMKGD